MAVYLDNLNMGYFSESEETYGSLMRLTAKDGKAIFGYYNLPYLNKHFGDAQIILRTRKREKEDTENVHYLQLEGLDTHNSGESVWEVCIHEMNINKKDSDILEKRVAVTRLDGGGMAVVNLINADVLPSFMKDDVIKMQMVAFPDLIEYYKNEDDYAAHQPENEEGKKWLIGEGCVLPTGFMRNRSPDSDEFESDESLDDITAVRGIVKGLYWGEIEFEGKSLNAYLKCIVDTDFGELEIVHTIDQVDEPLRCNMEVGATVVMYGTLSGDVAIDEYENGVIIDETNDLAAMRYMFSGNDPERIRSILSKDVIYQSQNGEEYKGADEIIDRLKYVQQNNPDKYFAHLAKICSIDDGEDKLDYCVGKLCLILASKDKTNYESIAFFDYDNDGKIRRILTSTNPRYHFTINAAKFNTEESESQDY